MRLGTERARAPLRIACIADLHLHNHRYAGGEVVAGVNDRCRAVLAAVEAAAAKAREEGCSALIVLGDVFDTPRPLPQQLVAFHEAFGTFLGRVILLVGNHDRVSDEPGDHALGPLVPWATVVERPRLLDFGLESVLCLPFDTRPVLEWLPGELTRHAGARVVCGHFGLYERAQLSAQPWLAEAHDAVAVEDLAPLLAECGVEQLAVGNYHGARSWSLCGVQLLQVGALVPTGWDNPGQRGYGGVQVIELGCKPHRHELPGLRFVVVHSEAELAQQQHEARVVGNQLHVDWRCAPEEFLAAQLVAERGRETGTRIEVHVERKHAERRALQAAVAARSTSSLGEAASAYVMSQAFTEVEPSRVLGHVRRFLGV